MGGSADGLDGVRLYLEAIGREPLLSANEEASLAQVMEAGRRAATELATVESLSPAQTGNLEDAVAAGERARQRFVEANLRLVVSVARQWTRSGLPFLDLIQEGNVGLLRAIERFDHRRGFRFSTYATWWIRQAISRAVANSGRLVRLPVHTGQAMMKVLREERRLEDSNGGRASTEEIAAALGLPVEQVSTLLRLAPQPRSISEPLGPDGPELAAVLADSTAVSPAEGAAASQLPAEVERLLEALDRRDRQVMTLRFGLDGDEPWGLDAIGRHVGLSREGVRQSQARALRTLRRLAFASPETRELLAR